MCESLLMLSEKSASIVKMEQVTFQWDDDDNNIDDDIRFVLDQNAGF